MILLVGTSVRSLMESAAQSGYEVIGLDFFGDIDAQWQGKTISLVQDCGLQPTVKNLLKIAKTIPCQGLVYGSGPENTPGELAFWQEQDLLHGNGTAILTEVRNPWNLRQSVERVQEKMPRFYPVEQWKQCEEGKRWILKPLNRGGGHGIVELPKQEEDILALIWSLSQPVQYIIQEYVEGVSASVTFLATAHESIVLGTSRQLIGRGGSSRPFCYEGNITPLDLPGIRNSKVFETRISKLVSNLCKDFGLKGINTLDFIVNSDGIWVLELNPRWSGSMELIEESWGKRLFAQHLAACAGKQVNFPERYSSGISFFRGKSIVYAPDSLVIRNREKIILRSLYDLGVRDIPRSGTMIPKGQPLCTVLARGISEQDCYLRLQAKKKWVQQYYGKVI